MSPPLEFPEDIAGRIRALCLALPEVTVRVGASLTRARSTARSFDIRRRSFCLLVAWEYSAGKPGPLLVLRARSEEREALLSIGHPFHASRPGSNESHSPVTDLPTSLHILCRLTSGNPQPYHPAAPELPATPN